VAESIDKSYFDFWGDDGLLVLEPISRADFDYLHRDLFARRGSIAVTPYYGK
jgi:hypothetical protein